MYGYIYRTTNLINNKIYIGQHKSEKFDDNYYGSGKLLKRALNKYGIENFKVEFIEAANDKHILNELEIKYITEYNTTDFNIGYNIVKGGNGGDIISQLPLEEQNSIILKRSSKIKNRIYVNKNNICKHIDISELDNYLQQGYVLGLPKNTIEKISISKKEFYKDNPNFRTSSMFKKGQIGIRQGKPVSTETRLKISRTLLDKYKGMGQSDETKQLKSKLLIERYRNGWQNPMKGKEPYNKGEKGIWFWYTNGIDNLRLKFDETIPEGYIRGRIVKNKITSATRDKLSKVSKNTIWVHNDRCNKRIKPELLNSYLQNGFILGKHSKY